MEQREWPLAANDGISLWGRSWQPAMPRAVVSLVHGRGEHSGRYQHVAQALNAAGYAVVAADLCGHGRSGGQRGHTPDYEALLYDVDLLVQETARRFQGLSHFIYGHSMGGNLALNYCLRRRPALAAAVVTSPWLRLVNSPPPHLLLFVRILDRLRPTYTLNLEPQPEVLSRDAAVGVAWAADPLTHEQITARASLSLYNAGIWALAHAADFSLPLLLLHGEQDELTSPQASQEFCAAAPNCTFRLWPGLRHETHNEPEQEEVLAAIVAWLDEQLAARA